GQKTVDEPVVGVLVTVKRTSALSVSCWLIFSPSYQRHHGQNQSKTPSTKAYLVDLG
ncbi:hypothetical protein AC249_AIPGENE24945, partial [Exaiptasia diaphana]